MGAIFPSEVTISIVSAGTAGSALASSDKVTTEISNFSVSGGTKDIESKYFFGGATIDVEKPREQYELSLDVVNTYANAVRWEGLLMGQGIDASSAESDTDPVAKRIFVEATDGSNYKTMAMDNCYATSYEPELASEEYMKGTITFKFSATDDSASANYLIKNVAGSDSFFD